MLPLSAAPYEHHIPSHIKKNYQGSIESTTPSLAPSQSASQIGRDDDSINSDGAPPSALGLHQQQYANEPAGSLASVIESDGSSSDGGGGRRRPMLKVVENTRNNGPTSPTSPLRAHHAPRNPPPAPSSTWNSRTAAKANTAAQPRAAYGGDDSDSSDAGTLKGASSRRRAQSDVGRSNTGSRRGPLERRTSNASSVSTSMRSDGSGGGGKQRKKGGFMNAIKALFAPRDKEALKRGSDAGRSGSPDSMQHYSSSWSTRTDRNVRRSGGGSEVGTSASGGGGGGGLSWGRKKSRLGASGNDSSSDDDGPARSAALVAVTNVGRTAGKKGEASGRTGEWMVEPVGAVRPGMKRSSSSRSTIKAGSADKKDNKRQSMIDFPPSTASGSKPKARAQASSDVGQATGLKASKSSATLKAKRSESELGTGVKVTTAPPGVKRSSSSSAVPSIGVKNSVTNGKPTGATAARKDAEPAPLPTLVSISAPRSINPSSSLTLPSAPGSSIVPASSFATPRPAKSTSSTALSPPAADTSSSGMKRSSTFSTGGGAAGSGAATPRPLSVASAIKSDKAENFAHSPAHRTASPPPRSALRQPRSMGELKPSALGQLPVMSVPTAPPPPSAFQAPNPAPATGGDEESVYETGLEDNASDDGNETDRGGAQGVTLGKQLNGLAPDLHLASPPGSHNGGGSNLSSSTANGTVVNANGTDTGATVTRRKSVRIEGVPPSPATESPPRQPKPGNYQPPGEKYFDGAVPVDVSGPSAWTSRIRASDVEASNVWGGPDSSDEDPDEGEYAMAKRAMQRAARKAEKAKAKGKGRQE